MTAPVKRVTIHLTTLPSDLVPIPARKAREWWQVDPRTRGHAHHCLPLTMANSLGYYILSPLDFRVRWDGGWGSDVSIEVPGGLSAIVDNHSANASFTVQPGFIPRTEAPGDFIVVKSIANERGAWFTVMEAMIEAWWQPADFGIVCLLNRAGAFGVRRGEPIAQMHLFRAEAGFTELAISTESPEETRAWRTRRGRRDYRKDLDYFYGRHPDLRPEPTHLTSWRSRAETDA